MPKNVTPNLWRFKELEKLRELFPVFSDFCVVAMPLMWQVETTTQQVDICNFLQYDQSNKRGILAQRSQGKSWLVSLYVIWRWIQDPRETVLLLSATKDNAEELVIGISQILFGWDILECLRPGKADRYGSTKLDVHSSLKGLNKSPSLNAMSILGSIQSKRATILIADDVESAKLSITATVRAAVLSATREFSAIVQDGDTLVLGTPQLSESVYNTLASRGYRVCIWPARVPTEKQLPHYSDMLAPSILDTYNNDPSSRDGCGLLRNRGRATDPELLNEELLIEKERDYLDAGFQLQYMLDTTLADQERFPLHVEDLLVTDLDTGFCPDSLELTKVSSNVLNIPEAAQFTLYAPSSTAATKQAWANKIAYIDTSGGGANSDEMAIVILYGMGPYMYIPDIMALQGGSTMSNIKKVARFCILHKVGSAHVETNYGGNAVVDTLRQAIYEINTESTVKHMISVQGDWVRGQKETRIIQALSPVMQQHRLILSTRAVRSNYTLLQAYPPRNQSAYCLLHQLKLIQYAKDALLHYDRIDALASAVSILVSRATQNTAKTLAEIHEERGIEFLKQFMPPPAFERAGGPVKRKQNQNMRRV